MPCVGRLVPLDVPCADPTGRLDAMLVWLVGYSEYALATPLGWHPVGRFSARPVNAKALAGAASPGFGAPLPES